MKLVTTKLGAEGQIDVDLTAGSLKVVASEDTPGIKVAISAEIPLVYYIDAGAQKLNSPLASSIAALLDGVLKNLP